jgi:biopolymer transport protein ExbD
MSIRFDCIKCNKSVSVHQSFALKQVRCPFCQFPLKVPKVSQQVEDEPVLVAESLDEELIEAVEAEPVEVEPVEVEVPVAEPSRAQTQPNHGSESHGSESHGGGHGRRGLKHEEEAEEDLEWDITPMVDVGFLLLIFFMLTASFSVQKAIPTSPPQEDKPSSNAVPKDTVKPTEVLIIQVDEFNGYTVITSDGTTLQASSKQELISNLKDLQPQYGDTMPKVLIQAHTSSVHGAVVSCIDAGREAGFTSFETKAVEEFD